MESGGAHRGLTGAIRATRARISEWTGGRPPVGRPESLAQWSRNRRRHDRSAVSGATITRASSVYGGHRQLALENLALRQQLAVYKEDGEPARAVHERSALLL
jgi:hypothetical protein